MSMDLASAMSAHALSTAASVSRFIGNNPEATACAKGRIACAAGPNKARVLASKVSCLRVRLWRLGLARAALSLAAKGARAHRRSRASVPPEHQAPPSARVSPGQRGCFGLCWPLIACVPWASCPRACHTKLCYLGGSFERFRAGFRVVASRSLACAFIARFTAASSRALARSSRRICLATVESNSALPRPIGVKREMPTCLYPVAQRASYSALTSEIRPDVYSAVASIRSRRWLEQLRTLH